MSQHDFALGLILTFAVSVAALLGYEATQAGDGDYIEPTSVLSGGIGASTAYPTSQIIRAPDGHYWAQADINGSAVRVLVDTGATVVALTRDDALRLGFMLESEDFNHSVMTASGPGRAARIELAHVAVAGARVERVQALVVERGLPASLLGMSYLGRLSRIEATPHGLTLRP